MVETITILDTIRLITGITILFYASYTDIKTRKAFDFLWIIMAAIGAILLVVQYLTTGFQNLFYLLFIPIMMVLIFIFYQVRLIIGGADLKALAAITILVPIEPVLDIIPIWKGGIMPFSWSIFTNSLIIFIFIPISLLIFNIAKKNIQFPHAFLGYKMNIQQAKEKFVWPLERLVDSKRKVILIQKNIDEEIDLNEFEKNNITDIWVTPKIPFMVPLLVGFIFAFIFGDILFYLLSLLF